MSGVSDCFATRWANGKIPPRRNCARGSQRWARQGNGLPHRDDLRTRSEAADLPQGVRGEKSRERREDGADDHPLNDDSKLASLCGSNAGRVSPRRSRIKDSQVRQDLRGQNSGGGCSTKRFASSTWYVA